MWLKFMVMVYLSHVNGSFKANVMKKPWYRDDKVIYKIQEITFVVAIAALTIISNLIWQK